MSVTGGGRIVSVASSRGGGGAGGAGDDGDDGDAGGFPQLCHRGFVDFGSLRTWECAISFGLIESTIGLS